MKFKRTIKYTLFNRILIYGFITWIQRVKGITSNIPDNPNYHYILLDFDDIDLITLKSVLEKLCIKYIITGFAVFSDKEKSYRVFSNTIVDFKTLLKIILDADGCDRMFFKWTVKRGYATIRISDKEKRGENKIVSIIGKIDIEIIKHKFKFVEYETDT